MENVIYKDKVLGVCALLFTVFGITPLIANGATTLTGDMPLYCQENYPSYTMTFTFDDFATDTGCGAWDYWNVSAKDYNGDRSPLSVDGFHASSSNSLTIEFSVDPAEISKIETAGYFYTDFNYVCGSSAEEESGFPSTFISVPVMGIQECLATTYSGMFPTGSKIILTNNVINFVSASGIMLFVLLFISIPLSFVIIRFLIKLTNPKDLRKEKWENEK